MLQGVCLLCDTWVGRVINRYHRATNAVLSKKHGKRNIADKRKEYSRLHQGPIQKYISNKRLKEGYCIWDTKNENHEPKQ